MTKPLTATINSSLDSGTNGRQVSSKQHEIDALRYLILNHGAGSDVAFDLCNDCTQDFREFMEKK